MHVFGFTLGCFTCYESPRYCPNIVLIVSAGIREFFEHCRNVTKCGCHLVKDFAVNSLTSVLCKHLFICFVYLGILVYTLKPIACILFIVCVHAGHLRQLWPISCHISILDNSPFFFPNYFTKTPISRRSREHFTLPRLGLPEACPGARPEESARGQEEI